MRVLTDRDDGLQTIMGPPRGRAKGHAMDSHSRVKKGVSIGVSVFTLVTISLERYFAICRPLTSLRWQTRRHACRTICVTWLVAVVVMTPTAVYQRLLRMPSGGHKCAEIWDDLYLEKVYTIFLDLALLVVPLTLMIVAYGRIALTLVRGFRQLNHDNTRRGACWMRLARLGERRTEPERRQARSPDEHVDDELVIRPRSKQSRRRQMDEYDSCSPMTGGDGLVGTSYVKSAGASSIRAKRRSVQMLTVVVVLFFVCWTPMYVMQTWSVFDYFDAVSRVSPTAMNYIHLLAFVSSCCNPITYCFMSAKFRQGFLDAFRCRRRPMDRGRSMQLGTELAAGHHHDTAMRSMLMVTTRDRRVTTTSAVSEHEVAVSPQL